MNPDPTVSTSCDYLVEFTDAEQPQQGNPEVIIIPPPPDRDSTFNPGTAPQQGPQS